MRTRVEVIDSLMNDLSLLKAYEKAYGKSKAKNIKDFGMSKPKPKAKDDDTETPTEKPKKDLKGLIIDPTTDKPFK